MARIVERAGIGKAEGLLGLQMICEDCDLTSLGAQITSGDGKPVPAEDRIWMARIFFAEEIQGWFRAMNAIWNTCYFGCLNAVHMMTYVDDDLVCSDIGASSRILGAFTENNFLDVLESSDIAPSTVLEWSLRCRGFWNGSAQSRVEKAVACLTHCFEAASGRQDTYSTLMWSLAGLEALFCDSEAGITYQIRRRAPLLLSDYPIRNLDKMLVKGYAFRSRLFHGDVRMVSAFRRDEYPSDDNGYELEAEKYADFFLAILCCSIRACIERGSTEVTFSDGVNFS